MATGEEVVGGVAGVEVGGMAVDGVVGVGGTSVGRAQAPSRGRSNKLISRNAITLRITAFILEPSFQDRKGPRKRNPHDV